MAQLDLRAQWLSTRNNVRVTVDGGEETVLQGTVLPPAEEGGGRRFRSRVGGRIQVLLVTDVPSSLSFVSLAVSAICADATGCGGHGSCSGGNCACSGGYSGMGACPTIAFLAASADPDVFLLLAVGCQCGVGYLPGGSECVMDKCYDLAKRQPKTCSGHGDCDASSGMCRCQHGYLGADCGTIDFPAAYQVANVPSFTGPTVGGPVDGTYTRQEGTLCNGKPVYKKKGLAFNFYMVLFQLKGDSRWAVGRTHSDKYCDASEGLYIMSGLDSCGAGACSDTPDGNGCKSKWASARCSGPGDCYCTDGGRCASWQCDVSISVQAVTSV